MQILQSRILKSKKYDKNLNTAVPLHIFNMDVWDLQVKVTVILKICLRIKPIVIFSQFYNDVLVIMFGGTSKQCLRHEKEHKIFT